MDFFNWRAGRADHLKWLSFDNIHTLVAKQKITDDPVLVLEKLDGSNLGREICPNDGLLAIHGRRSIIWHNGMNEDAFDRKYGSVSGTINPIAHLVP